MLNTFNIGVELKEIRLKFGELNTIVHNNYTKRNFTNQVWRKTLLGFSTLTRGFYVKIIRVTNKHLKKYVSGGCAEPVFDRVHLSHSNSAEKGPQFSQ